jgi:hypothetical protein
VHGNGRKLSTMRSGHYSLRSVFRAVPEHQAGVFDALRDYEMLTLAY